MERKFDNETKKKVLNDWLSCLPAMSRYRPMWLLKRNGPLLVGVCLSGNRDNTTYRIIPHVHNLTRPINFVSLTLWYPLKNNRNTYHEALTVRSHDREFPDACIRLKKQTIFPLEAGLLMSQAIRAYETYISRNLMPAAPPNFLYQDILCLLSWCGNSTEASKRLSTYIGIMSEWEDRIFEREGGKSAFFDRLVDIVERPKELEAICEQQMQLLKLKKIPDYGLSCS